jgi:hypothetical protein
LLNKRNHSFLFFSSSVLYLAWSTDIHSLTHTLPLSIVSVSQQAQIFLYSLSYSSPQFFFPLSLLFK